MIMSRRHFNSSFFFCFTSHDSLIHYHSAGNISKKRFKRNVKGEIFLLFLFFTFCSLHLLLSDRLFGSSQKCDVCVSVEATRNSLSSHWFLEFQHILIQIRYVANWIECAARAQNRFQKSRSDATRCFIATSYKLQLSWLCIWLETKRSTRKGCNCKKWNCRWNFLVRMQKKAHLFLHWVDYYHRWLASRIWYSEYNHIRRAFC